LKVVFASDALRDLELIGDWIAQDSPRRALSYVRDLRAMARSLGSWPLRYPAIGPDERLRRAPYGAYNIHYVLFEDRVMIWRILHSAVEFEVVWPDPE
jgi:plasmid stabilization system protein ParE